MAVIAGSRGRLGASSFTPSVCGLVSLNAMESKTRKAKTTPSAMSKASYAEALRDQIEAKYIAQNTRAESADRVKGGRISHGRGFFDLIGSGNEAASRAMGQRNGGQMGPTSKESYASELRAQIAARELLRIPSKLDCESEVSNFGFIGAGEESLRKVGKRCDGPVGPQAKGDYATILRDQIQARADLKANKAFEEPLVSLCNDEVAQDRGRRRAQEPMDKASYASALKEQISDDAMRRAAEKVNIQFALQTKTGVDAVARGRRPPPAPLSGEAYLSALQAQIADHAALREADRFSRPRNVQKEADVVQGNPSLQKAKSSSVPELLSNEGYSKALHEQNSANFSPCVARASDGAKCQGGGCPGGIPQEAEVVTPMEHTMRLAHQGVALASGPYSPDLILSDPDVSMDGVTLGRSLNESLKKPKKEVTWGPDSLEHFLCEYNANDNACLSKQYYH